jgi:hypothetical protein
MRYYLLSSRYARCLKISKQLVNREELGKLIAQTSGAISMINESNIWSDRHLATTLIPSLHPNQTGLVHVLNMRAIMPSASMYMQLNFIVVKARHFNPLNQVDRCYHFSLTNKQSIIFLSRVARAK